MAHAITGSIPSDASPFEAFPSPKSVPRHRGRYPLAIGRGRSPLDTHPVKDDASWFAVSEALASGCSPSTSPLHPAGVAANGGLDAPLGFSTCPGSLSHAPVAFHASRPLVPKHHLDAGERGSCRTRRVGTTSADRSAWLVPCWPGCLPPNSGCEHPLPFDPTGCVRSQRSCPSPTGPVRGAAGWGWTTTSSNRTVTCGSPRLFRRPAARSVRRRSWLHGRSSGDRRGPCSSAGAGVRSVATNRRSRLRFRGAVSTSTAPKCSVSLECSFRSVPLDSFFEVFVAEVRLGSLR